ncbi:MAG: response regulator transcription factor [Candidatus Omnitrophica bacterium]|nr:response regulator transcription factor [Candidatus Omnitrophota bacterium]
MRVLLVEDEKKMSSFIERGLSEEGYGVDTAFDGEEGLALVNKNSYDLMILDWMLPKLDGLALCKKVREKKLKTPIIILTAKDAVEEKIQGLDGGADDYLTKPFAFDELLARMRAMLRRPHDIQKESQLIQGNLCMDLLSREVRINEKVIILSQKEFSLLEFLIRHKGDVVTRTQIAEHVWDQSFDPMSNTIDVYINFLRKKIDSLEGPGRIETIRGAGYRLLPE